MRGKWIPPILIGLLLLTTGIALAQTTVEVKRGQVLAVHGNDLVFRGEDGVKTVTVPDDFRFDVQGQQLSVHELKPGMTLKAIIKTTTKVVPMTVTEVRSGTVVHTQGGAVVFRRDTGELVKVTKKTISESGAMVTKDGKPIDLMTLREGDKITATVVTKLPPETITEEEMKVYAIKTPQKPAPAPAPAPVVVAKKEPAPTALPKTAGPLPMIALGGLAILGAGVAMTAVRRSRSR